MDAQLYSTKSKDYAFHSQEWEWWYFDGVFDNGYQIAACWFFGNPATRVPEDRFIQFMIHDPDGNPVAAMPRFPLNRTFASTETCDVKMGDNRIYGDAPQFELHFRSGDMGADLSYKNVTQGVREPPDGIQVGRAQDPCTARYLGWVIYPRSTVTGKLIVAGKEISVKGEGYQDKNWGNGLLGDHFDHWYWGRLHFPNLTLAYWDGQQSPANGNQRFKRLWVLKGEKLIEYSKDSIYTEAADLQTELPSNYVFPQTLVLAIDGIRIKGTVTQRFRHWMVGPPLVLPGRSCYVRWLADCEAKLEVDGEKVEATTRNILDRPVW